MAPAADHLVMIQAMIDPDGPPLASHFTTMQARSYISALLGGDRDAEKMTVSSAGRNLEVFLPAG